MATPNRPVIGQLYSLGEQHAMHGGSTQRCAPPKDGRVLLLRVRPELNPDAPDIIDWGKPNDPWVDQIASQKDGLPVYIRRDANEWEYMGVFVVTHVVTDKRTLAKRMQLTGDKVSYSIHLESK